MLFHTSDKRLVQVLTLFHTYHPSANAIPQAGDYTTSNITNVVVL
jgi:hypothetical protein